MHPIFPELPSELLELIIENLPYKKDRRALWRVSRRFREHLNTHMFETLTIRAKEHNLARLDARLYGCLDATRPLSCLRLVKNLHLKAPFHEMLSGIRCPHHQLSWDTDVVPKAEFASLIALLPLLIQLKVKGLASFSWDLGMCIPGNILGPEGYLTKKQTAIESLSLITNMYRCRFYPSSSEIVVLSNFPKLRKFSWKGLNTTEELESLRGLFISNFRVLEDLELDFIDWRLVTIDDVQMQSLFDEPPPSFTDLILPHKANRVVQQFKSLKRLALSEFCFEAETKSIARAFNVRNLRSLTMRNCTGILTFLSTIVDAGLILRLTSLELIIEDEAVEHDGTLKSPLLSFLQSFQGLEHFHLMLRADILTPYVWSFSYWNAIQHHSSTLKSLVYHERRPTTDDERRTSNGDEFWIDKDHLVGPWPESDAEKIHLMQNHVYNSGVAQLQLQRLAIGDSHEWVWSVMEAPSDMQNNIQLLHFRRTGTDGQTQGSGRPYHYHIEISDLIQPHPSSRPKGRLFPQFMSDEWPSESNSVFRVAVSVFKSSKFENLKVLAFGDFSHGGRYKGRNLLLCRAATSSPEVRFRVMTREDIDFYKRSGLLSLDFLAACPRESLLVKWNNEGEFP